MLCSVAASLLCEFSIGQFTCLLLTVDMVAVSQAASPESNPDSPLPVMAQVGQDLTCKLIGASPHLMPAFDKNAF